MVVVFKVISECIPSINVMNIFAQFLDGKCHKTFNNKSALVQEIAWYHQGYKPLTKPVLTKLYVTT